MAKTRKPSATPSSQKGQPKQRKRPRRSNRYRDFKCRRIYHVYQRGNDGRCVFLSDEERVAYLEHLFFLGRRYSVKIHNFCLMPTHVHLVLEQRQKEGISNLMRELQSTHTRAQNKRRDSYGNLWTQHFGCKHVNSDAYFQTLTWYLGNNPVKTGKVKKAADYLWSGAQILAAGGPVTIEFKGHDIELSLHMDKYEEVCKKEEWQETLSRDKVATEMAEEIKELELIMDGKALRQAANEERIKKQNEKKAKERAAKADLKKFGVGGAKEAAAARAEKEKTEAKGSPRTMRAG